MSVIEPIAPFGALVEQTADETVVRLTGELDVSSAPALRECLDAIDANGRVVLDLEKLEFMDSTGIGIIIGTAKRLAPSGGVRLRNPSKPLRRLLDITGAASVVPVEQ